MVAKNQSTDVKVADALAQTAKYLSEPSDEKFTWQSVKDKLARYVGALVMEKDSDDRWVISIGRCSWWLAFLPALYIFVAAGTLEAAGEVVSKDITPNHLTILLALATYNFGKKIADTVKKVWGKNNGPG